MPRYKYRYYATSLPCEQFHWGGTALTGGRGPWPPLRTASGEERKGEKGRGGREKRRERTGEGKGWDKMGGDPTFQYFLRSLIEKAVTNEL